MFGAERAHGFLRGLRESPMRAWLLSVLLVYSALVALGITTSSMGISTLLDDSSDGTPGLIVGSPDPIRSDEYLRGTPWTLGTMVSGGVGFGTPLSYPDNALVASKTGGVVTDALFGETTVQMWIGRWIPEQAFAAVWWLPVLLVALFVPLWFREFGVTSSVSVPISILVLVAPASVWWSWGPTGILGWAAVAGTAASASARHVVRGGAMWQGWLLAAVASFALARLALTYQPWAIPIGASVLVPTLAAMLTRRGERLRTAGLAALILIGGLFVLGLFFLEHQSSAAVLADTVYPGSRQFTGALVSMASLFAGPHLWILQKNPPLVATNHSEISAGYLFFGAVALALVPVIAWRRVRKLRWPATTAGCMLGALATWCLVDWPTVGQALFPMSLVSPGRLAQVLGISATLTFGLFFAAWRATGFGRRLPTAVAVAVLTFFVTAVGGSSFRQLNLPPYRALWVILVSLLTAGVVAGAIYFAQNRFALVPAALCAIGVTAFVSPVQQGFADLRDGSAAQVIRAEAQTAGHPARWVSDDIHADALLMANAVPAVSGQQWVGPRRSAWKILDPDGRYEAIWNRGAAYVTFSWARPGSETNISLPGNDFILVSLDVCSTTLDKMKVERVLSTTPLEGQCLDQSATFEFGGRTRYVYARS